MSQSTLPAAVRTSSARCPIAIGGSAPTPTTAGPSSATLPWWPAACSSASDVQRCPPQPTYCRSSRQIGQSSRAAPYCTPHVAQIGKSVLTPHLYHQLTGQAAHPGQHPGLARWRRLGGTPLPCRHQSGRDQLEASKQVLNLIDLAE